MEFVSEKAPDYIPQDGEPDTFQDALTRDPIAMVRSVVRGVRTGLIILISTDTHGFADSCLFSSSTIFLRLC